MFKAEIKTEGIRRTLILLPENGGIVEVSIYPHGIWVVEPKRHDPASMFIASMLKYRMPELVELMHKPYSLTPDTILRHIAHGYVATDEWCTDEECDMWCETYKARNATREVVKG